MNRNCTLLNTYECMLEPSNNDFLPTLPYATNIPLPKATSITFGLCSRGPSAARVVWRLVVVANGERDRECGRVGDVGW